MVFFFQAEDGIRDGRVTGVQTCALPISPRRAAASVPAAVANTAWAAPRARRRKSSCRARSEERRVGKECRARGSPEPHKKQSRLRKGRGWYQVECRAYL